MKIYRRAILSPRAPLLYCREFSNIFGSFPSLISEHPDWRGKEENQFKKKTKNLSFESIQRKLKSNTKPNMSKAYLIEGLICQFSDFQFHADEFVVQQTFDETFAAVQRFEDPQDIITIPLHV